MAGRVIRLDVWITAVFRHIYAPPWRMSSWRPIVACAPRAAHQVLCLRFASPGEDPKEMQRICKRYKRRTWPGWTGATTGQFNALLRPDEWHFMVGVERDVQRAGAASAQKTASTRVTPYDHFQRNLIERRKKRLSEQLGRGEVWLLRDDHNRRSQ